LVALARVPAKAILSGDTARRQRRDACPLRRTDPVKGSEKAETRPPRNAMVAESLSTFLLTAVAVGLFLSASRLWSPHTSGWLSSLPVIGAPSLLWLHATRGPQVAATASAGSIASVAACAVFIAVYARIHRRSGRSVAALAGCAACLLASLPLMGWTPRILGALVLAHATVVVCAAVLRRPAVEAPDTGASRPMARATVAADVVLTAVTAGLVSVVVGRIADSAGPFTAGLFASLPLMAAFVVSRIGGPGRDPAVTGFAAGYLQGLHGRCVFALVFSLLIGPAGPAAATFVSSLACIGTIGLLERRPRRPSAMGIGASSTPGVVAR